jgi:hypothetical protein
MMAARERLEGLQQQSSEDEDVTDLGGDQGNRPGSSSSLRQREAGVAQRVVSSTQQSSSSGEESEDEDEEGGDVIHGGEEYRERDDSVDGVGGSDTGNASDFGDDDEPIQTMMMLCHRCGNLTTFDPRPATPNPPPKP